MDEEKYRKVFVPKDPSVDAKLNVEVGFDVIDIVEINEPKVFYMVNQLVQFILECESHMISDVILIGIQCVDAVERLQTWISEFERILLPEPSH